MENLKNFNLAESMGEQALLPVKVDFSADRLLVSARDLHEFLGVGTQYNKWFPRMCEYGFTEGADFWTFLTESTGGRPGGDAALTIDMAKEIAMLQRNDKGKQARLYFLQLEKDWNSPEKVMARALKIADAKINALTESNTALTAANAQLTESNAALTAQIEADAPRVLWAKTAEGGKKGMLIREFCKFLRPLGAAIGEKRMFADLRAKGFLIKAEGRDKNKPTQRAVEQGLFTVKETVIARPNGETIVNTTPLLTEKGKEYFATMYLSPETVNDADAE